MSHFKQFTRLIEDYPQFFNGDRKAAEIESFSQSLLADDDGFIRRFGSAVAEMMKPDYGVNVNGVTSPLMPAAAIRRNIPDFAPITITCVNDTYHIPHLSTDQRVKCAVYDADNFPFPINAYHTPSHFNRIFANKILHISIDGGNNDETAIQINNILAAAVDLAAFRRVFIEIGGGANLELILNDSSDSTPHNYFASQFVEIFLNEGASLNLYDITDTSDTTSRLNEMKIKMKRNCRLNIFSLSASAGKSVNIYDIDFESDNSEATINGFVVGDGNQRIGNATFVNHLSRHGKSNQYFKYVLDDASHGTFYGEIFVWEVARFTEAYQSNRNILASPDARISTEPQLLIYNDDVKCSHGATTGQLDAAALFYMRQRGIPEAVARTMLTQAFVGDVIDAIPLLPLRDRMRMLVEKRLYKRSSRPCDNCRMACDTINRDFKE